MRCVDCEHFRVLYEPIKGVDLGRAECGKNNLITDFLDRRKLNALTCWEDNKMTIYEVQTMMVREGYICANCRYWCGNRKEISNFGECGSLGYIRMQGSGYCSEWSERGDKE